MLECREYQYKELAEYLKSKDPQAIERKLKNYGVEFSKEGKGKRATYTITAINNPFKVFAVFDMEVAPQTDLTKFAYFIYLLLNDAALEGMGAEMMEEHFRTKPINMSRQTIAKYIRKLEQLNYISTSFTDFIYYKVYKKFGVQTHEVVTRKEYAEAWKIYWDCKAKKYDTPSAFMCMYNSFGGTPRKHPLIEPNVFYKDVLDWLNEILSKDFGDIEEPKSF